MIARTALGKILVFAIFFVGIATGAVLTNVYRTRIAASDTTPNKGDRSNPQDRARRDQDQMAKYLGLDQAQQDQIHKILEICALNTASCAIEGTQYRKVPAKRFGLYLMMNNGRSWTSFGKPIPGETGGVRHTLRIKKITIKTGKINSNYSLG